VTAPTPYLHLPGTARDALGFYAQVFGGEVELHTFAEFGRANGSPEYIAHGYLRNGPVELFASDVVGDQPSLRCVGLMLSLLGTASPSTLRDWFAGLSAGGQVLEALMVRPWGAFDGQVVDRFGIHWLIGFEDESET